MTIEKIIQENTKAMLALNEAITMLNINFTNSTYRKVASDVVGHITQTIDAPTKISSEQAYAQGSTGMKESPAVVSVDLAKDGITVNVINKTETPKEIKQAEQASAIEEINYDKIVKPKTIEFVQTFTRPMIEPIFKQFGVTNAQQLKKEQYADYLKVLENFGLSKDNSAVA